MIPYHCLANADGTESSIVLFKLSWRFFSSGGRVDRPRAATKY